MRRRIQRELILSKFKVLGVIPARDKSTRLPGKPLIEINGIPMIERTYRQAAKAEGLDKVLVATESEKIAEYCESREIPVMLTADTHLTGTDRMAEVAMKLDYELYVNIQGDEPVIDPKTIDEIIAGYREHHETHEIYNLYKVTKSQSDIDSQTLIKVIINEQSDMMYMSRLPIPFSKSGLTPTYLKQVCVYGITKPALLKFTSTGKTLNEQFEDIEMLRFVDMGYKVKMIQTHGTSIAVDVPGDVQKVEDYLKAHNLG